MLENLQPSTYNKDDKEEIALPSAIYLWATTHTRLCHTYVNENDGAHRNELDEKLENSLHEGKQLLDTFLKKINSSQKPFIPISGINRFTKPKEMLNTKENLSSKVHYPFRAELGTSCHVKTIPLPSKTYLKNKNPTQ